MQKLLRTLRLLSFAALFIFIASAAHADGTPPVVDYAALVNGARNEFITAVLVVGPIVFALMGIMAAVRWGWQKARSGMRI